MKFSKEYLPKLSCGYASSKHELHIGCGKEFMKRYRNEFDVIITDSSDCVGMCMFWFSLKHPSEVTDMFKAV